MLIEWICDYCGACLGQFDERIPDAIEDICEDCADHGEHCHEFVAYDCHAE